MQIYTIDNTPEPASLAAPAAVIPAAGQARRLGLTDVSKEVLPIGVYPDTGQPKPVAAYMLEQLARAGVGQVFFVLRDGKWDIPAQFGHGARFGLDIGYLLMNHPFGPPFTANQASPFLAGRTVLFGFPDILIWPHDAFAQTLHALEQSDADVMLGAFDARPDQGCDLLTMGDDGLVSAVTPKESSPVWPANGRTWLLAAWRPAFTRFLNQMIVNDLSRRCRTGDQTEWPFGVILGAALESGLRISALHFADGRFLDIGEHQRLAQASDFPGVTNVRPAAGPEKD